MEHVNPAADQPDFAAVFRYATTEFEKLKDIPAIASGERILAELKLVKTEIRVIRDEIRQGRGEMLIILGAGFHNATARIQNTYVKTRFDALYPLINCTTGLAIQDFPTTAAELENLPEHRLDTILRELGIPQPAIHRDAAAKKMDLRVQIGLRPVAEVGA